MRNWNRFGKRIVTYTTAAALAVTAAFGVGGFVSEAKSYIQYHNIIVRDAAAGEIIGGVDAGQEVTVLGTSTGSDGKTWSQVRYVLNGVTHEGWVRSDLITEDASKVEGGMPGENEPEEPQDPPQRDEPEGADPAPETEEPQSQPEKEPQQEDAGEISGDGYLADGKDSFLVRGKSMVLSDDFSDADIPDGFEKTSITYNGKEVQALKANHGELFLVYLKDGETGDFYVLDTERNCVFSLIQFTAGDTSVVLTLAPLEEKIASCYKKMLFTVNETDGITAYGYAQDPTTFNKDVSAGDYFYVYGMDQEGVSGWFLYDSGTKTFVRSTSDLGIDVNAASERAQKETQTLGSMGRIIVVGVLLLFVILLIAVIALGVRCRRMRNGLPEEEYEDEVDDEYEDEPRMTFAERRRERRSYRHFMDDDYEEDADEEEAQDPSEGFDPHVEEVFVLDGQDDEEDYLDEEEGQEPEDWEELIRQIEAERELGRKKVPEEEPRPASKQKQLDDNFDDDLEFLDL